MLFVPYQKRNKAPTPPAIRTFVPRPPKRTDVREVEAPPPEEQEPKRKPMKWGEPTWFLFHTLAEKIKPEHFAQYKDELFDVIRSICNTLPCPDCAKHATQHMQKINFNSIRTKEDLQTMLWSFHNEVNARKGYAKFPIENLSEKYSKGITRNIIQLFIMVHSDKHSSFRMLSNEFYRANIVARLKTWFIQHIHIFEE
jgi:hypothetical protein